MAMAMAPMMAMRWVTKMWHDYNGSKIDNADHVDKIGHADKVDHVGAVWHW